MSGLPNNSRVRSEGSERRVDGIDCSRLSASRRSVSRRRLPIPSGSTRSWFERRMMARNEARSPIHHGNSVTELSLTSNMRRWSRSSATASGTFVNPRPVRLRTCDLEVRAFRMRATTSSGMPGCGNDCSEDFFFQNPIVKLEFVAQIIVDSSCCSKELREPRQQVSPTFSECRRAFVGRHIRKDCEHDGIEPGWRGLPFAKPVRTLCECARVDAAVSAGGEYADGGHAQAPGSETRPRPANHGERTGDARIEALRRAAR